MVYLLGATAGFAAGGTVHVAVAVVLVAAAAARMLLRRTGLTPLDSARP